MKSKLVKCVVAASALFFMNCSEDSSSVTNVDPLAQSSADAFLFPTSSTDAFGNPIMQSSAGGAYIASAGSSAGAFVGSSDAQVAFGSSSSGIALPPTNDTQSAPSAQQSSSGTAPAAQSSSSGTAPAAQSSSSGTAAVSSSSVKPEESNFVTPAIQPAVDSKIFLADDKDEDKEPMQVEYFEHTGFDGGGILSYPKQLSNDKKHAVVVWGPGGGTEPGAYGGMIHRLASHGFVVIALRESPGNASQAIPALDWLEKKNNDPNDPLYQKLDMNTVGCSGHSMGGLESEQAVIKDKRVLTAMLNNSGDLGHTAMSQVGTDKTIGIVYGEAGMERPNAEADYNNPGVKAPACLIQMTGGPKGGEGGYGHGSGPWDGISATVAWMRWHLGGEDFRKADFVGGSGKYIDGPIIGHQGNWKGTCKNF